MTSRVLVTAGPGNVGNLLLKVLDADGSEIRSVELEPGDKGKIDLDIHSGQSVSVGEIEAAPEPKAKKPAKGD